MMHKVLLAVGVAVILGGAAALPARADDDWRRHEWREHERHEHWRHEWCEHHPYRCGVPGYVYGYAPPPVVYAPPPPPPVVYAPPSLNVVIPLR